MNQDLDQLAERIIRNQEVVEFIQGLVTEKGVSPEAIIRAAAGQVSPGGDRGGTGRFLEPLPGADPHDPDGGHDNQEH